MKKRILSLLLAIVMLVGIMPTAAFAETQAQSGITVYVTMFNKGEFCKTKDNEIMWQKAVTVMDTNKDGKYSLDETLTAAHGAYHTSGADAYATEYSTTYQSKSVIKLWGIDTYATGYYRNNAITNSVDQEFVEANDKITAFIYYDETGWSDRYSFFTEETKTVDVAQEFSLTLKYSGYDSSWNPAELPVKAAPIGVYDMKTGAYSVPTALKGEELFEGFFMPTVSTGNDGSARMQFTEIGKYYVTAQYNSSNYSTYDDTLGSVPNYLVPPVCVITVVDADIKETTAKIDAIGTVTENSGDAIQAARAAYDALTDAQKALVSNYATLTNSEIAYDKILTDKADKEMADNVTALIAAIGTVTENSGDAIQAARTAYNALTDAQKTMVSNLTTLTDAEKAYAQIISDKEDRKKADNVIALIAAIGTVTENSGEKIAAARTAYDALNDTQKALVTNYDVLTDAEKAFYHANIQNIHSTTEKYLLHSIPDPVYGSEWAIIALARNNAKVPAGYYAKYYQAVEKYVKENINDGEKLSNTRSTENSRLIIALTAIGKDPTNVGGHNLLAALADLDYVKTQGLNGVVWALIALDTHNFEIPTVQNSKVQTTREALIHCILSQKLTNGGWALSGDAADPDMTGIVIQALAPYYNTNETVKNVVDDAVAVLSSMQQDDGGFASWGVASAESAAQVITALSAIGIDANTDARFIKGGNSVYDALMTYYAVGGGFKSSYDNKVNTLTTCQAFYSMAAYNRFKAGEAPLYDMSDVETDSPETSDNSNVALWFVVLAASAMALTFTVFKKKKVF